MTRRESERRPAEVERERLLADLERRRMQLQTAAELSRIVGTTLDPDELIWAAVELIRGRLGLTYVGLFLVDRASQWAILRAGTGTQGQAMVEHGHRLAVGGDSMIGQCVALGRAQIALSATSVSSGREDPIEPGTHDRRVANPLLPYTRSEMALPLISRGETLGAVTIQSTDQVAFSEEDVAALQTMAGQLAVALENARLLEEARTQAEELVVLDEMSRALSTVRTVDEVIVSTHHYVSRLMDAANFYIGLYDRERNQVTIPLNVIESEVDRQITVIPADEGLTGYILRTRESLLIEEDVAGWLSARGIEVLGQVSQSWLGVPLLIGETVLGVMAIQDYTKPRAFAEADRERMISVANQVTLAIQNTRLFEEIQARARYEQTLREITARVRSSTDPDAIVRTAVRELGRAMGRRVFVRMGNEESLSRSERTGLEGGT